MIFGIHESNCIKNRSKNKYYFFLNKFISGSIVDALWRVFRLFNCYFSFKIQYYFISFFFFFPCPIYSVVFVIRISVRLWVSKRATDSCAMLILYFVYRLFVYFSFHFGWSLELYCLRLKYYGSMKDSRKYHRSLFFFNSLTKTWQEKRKNLWKTWILFSDENK